MRGLFSSRWGNALSHARVATGGNGNLFCRVPPLDAGSQGPCIWKDAFLERAKAVNSDMILHALPFALIFYKKVQKYTSIYGLP
jgi:hypothetical protein